MKKKILICDNHPAILEVVKEILESNDYEVITCNSTKSILSLIEQVKPDMLIIDYRMPGENGAEVVKQVRKHSELSNIPVLAFSAMQKIKKIMLEAGADAFLPKPFEITQLDEALRISNENARKRSRK